VDVGVTVLLSAGASFSMLAVSGRGLVGDWVEG
jgi:hypothetical protein